LDEAAGVLSGLAMAEKIVEQQAGSLSTVTRALRELIEAKKNGRVSKPTHAANEKPTWSNRGSHASRSGGEATAARPERGVMVAQLPLPGYWPRNASWSDPRDELAQLRRDKLEAVKVGSAGAML
jgi:hypothetical protein